MGSFFSNVHIKKQNEVGVETVASCLIQGMEQAGYKQADKEEFKAMIAIFAPKEGDWITVASDVIQWESAEEVSAYLTPFSKDIGTDVLAVSCFDSDYLFINWINAKRKVDAWMNVGKSPEIPCPRRTNAAAWKKVIKQHEPLKRLRKEAYVFAEEFMEPFGALIGLPAAQGCLTQEMFGVDIGAAETCTLYFAEEERQEEQQEELPELWNMAVPFLPYRMEEEGFVSAINRGGRSKGLGIGIYIEGKKEDEITFSDVKLCTDFEKRPLNIRPITLEKRQLANGEWAYWWEDENLPLRPKISGERNRELRELGRSMTLWFTPHGNPRKAMDIAVTFVPLENRIKGQCTWCCWWKYGSKAAFIQANNEQLKRGSGIFLNPDDYDLD